MNNTSDTKTRIFVGICYTTIAVVVFFGVWYVWNTVGHSPLKNVDSAIGDFPTAGQFGDSFGYINSLFSGFAFAGVILTILLQWNELRLQRIEINESQKVWRESAAAQEASHAALLDQSDSLFVAAYLNALSSVAQPATGGSEHQRQAIEKISQLLPFLEVRTSKIIGRAIRTTSKEEWLADEIDKICTVLRLVLDGHNTMNTADAKTLKRAVQDAHDDFKGLVPHLVEPSVTESASKILNCTF